MRRLIHLFSAVVLAAFATESARSNDVILTVAGDVPQAHTYEVQLTGPASVMDLLELAGLPPNVRGVACVFRNDPPQHVRSDAVQSGSVHRGPQLSPGDIVLFHATTPVPDAVANVVISATGLPRVMHLPNPDFTIADLLTLLEVEFTADDRVSVLRTEQGMLVDLNARPDDVLVNGDVIRLAMTKDVDQAVISRLFDSQQSTADETRVADRVTPEEPISPMTDGVAFEVLDSVLNSPSVPARSVSDSFPLNARAFPDEFQILPFDAIAVPAESVPPAPEKTAQKARSTSMNEVDGKTAEPLIPETVRVRPPRRSWLLRNPQPEMQPEIPIAISANSPDPWATPAEPATASASASPLWNGIFTFGLFGAIVLITVGWLKTRTEQKTAEVRARELMNLTISDSFAGVEQRPSVEQTFSATDAELERLIRNRIPMQLSQTSLPLRVTLFGRPAGPQRLRIDAAHEKVSAPHFAAGSRKQNQRREQIQVASVSPETADSGSLDRALNSLRGRHE